MFHNRKRPPDTPFAHNPDCRIRAADPAVQIPWSEIRAGAWEARCVCGVQYAYEQTVDNRVRLDPLDPKTGGHLPQCEFAAGTDPSVIRVLLKVTDKGATRGCSAARATAAGRFRTTPRASGDVEPAAARRRGLHP